MIREHTWPGPRVIEAIPHRISVPGRKKRGVNVLILRLTAQLYTILKRDIMTRHFRESLLEDILLPYLFRCAMNLGNLR
jgi:hypothetical protein